MLKLPKKSHGGNEELPVSVGDQEKNAHPISVNTVQISVVGARAPVRGPDQSCHVWVCSETVSSHSPLSCQRSSMTSRVLLKRRRLTLSN